MMKRLLITGIILTTILLIASCAPGGMTTNQIAQTAAARTQQQMEVDQLVQQLTHAAEETLRHTLEMPSPTASNTPTITSTVTATSTNTPTQTATFTNTSIPPTSTATSIPCNHITFIGDVSIPDGTDFYGGEVFTKTWRLKNTGSCTWGTDYDLIFVSGNAMSGPAAVDLPTSVAPNETIDISVTLQAPNDTGTYTGYWKLRSNAGVIFGYGIRAENSFWVSIDVTQQSGSPAPGTVLDFAFSYYQASWESTTGPLSVYGSTDDFNNGSIYRTNSPVFENGYQDDEPTLIMIPNDGSGGMIMGKYPAVAIDSDDRLHALIGCVNEMEHCNVMFQINYSADGGAVQNLGTWTEIYDDNLTTLDIDLSFLAGKSVQFTLLVHNNGDSYHDKVFWLAPQIID